ncbi:MAG TPA: ATP-binding protein [Geminicoccaceae bacterium]|nr:ATP-binding protein [Geminicoccaceae bacterium]
MAATAWIAATAGPARDHGRPAVADDGRRPFVGFLSSLETRLLCVLGLVVLPLVALSLHIAVQAWREQIAEARAEVLRLARIIAQEEASQIAATRLLLATLARLPGVRTGDREVCGGQMAQLLEEERIYLNFGATNGEGAVVCSGRPMPAAVDAADRPWFRRAEATGAFAVGDYEIGPITGRPTIGAAAPLFDARGTLSRVVFASISLDWLAELIARVKLPPDATVTVVDGGGTVLAHLPDRPDLVGRPLPHDRLAGTALGRGGAGVAEARDGQGVRRLVAYVPMDNAGVRVLVARPAPSAAAAILPGLLGIAFEVLALAGVLALGRTMLLRPIQALAEATDRLARGDLTARSGVDPCGRGELGRLAWAFDRMAERLQRREEELRRSNAELEQFASVASHDLREPLRTIASFALMLERRCRDRLDAEADEFLHFIVDGTRRMQTLIDDLLAFSRLGRADDRVAPLDLNAVLDWAEADLRGAIEGAGAEIVRGPLPAVHGNAGQLVQLFQNLLGNAIKFRAADRPPRIEVRARRCADGATVIAVRDNGIGIDPRHAERVFVIFQRLHTRREYPGTGIGLALCKKIVERHGGRIWFESKPGEGSTFHVAFPDRPRGERDRAGDEPGGVFTFGQP